MSGAVVMDAAGKRLSSLVVPDRYDTDPPWEPPITPVPLPPTVLGTESYVVGSGNKRWCWMSADGKRLYNYQDSAMRVSTDASSQATISSGQFSTVHTFMQETDDGELLVCLNSAQTDPAGAAPEVWKSTGYNFGANMNPTWAKVLTGTDGGAWFETRFSHWSDGPLIGLVEYGSKGTQYAAKRGYVSTDYGSTFRAFFTHPGTDATNSHVHSIAYDKYWDRWWITTGDGSPNRGIFYSDDWRATAPTWHLVPGSDGYQVVTIYPLRSCILFLSDNAPNGVMRYKRTGYRTLASTFETAHSITALAGNQYVGGTAYRRSPNDPLLMTFTPSASPALPSVLVATWDGLTFYDLWIDPQGNYVGGYSQGLFTAFGPFVGAAGINPRIIGDLRDDRNSYTTFSAPAPTWRKTAQTSKPDGTVMTVISDASGHIGTQAPDGTKVYSTDGTPVIADNSIDPVKLTLELGPQPTDQQLIAWAFDPVGAQSQTALTAGTLTVVRIPIRHAATITNLLIYVAVAGSGLTAGQCFAALYQGGNLLAVTADQATAWASSGLKTMALATQQAVAAGFFDVAFWATGTTMPQVARGSTNSSHVNAGAATKRFSTADTGLTTTAPSTIGARTANVSFWAAVS